MGALKPTFTPFLLIGCIANHLSRVEFVGPL